MSKTAWRPPGSYKLSRLSFFSLLVFGAIYGTFLLHSMGGIKAATSLCEGQPGVFTMVAPASVTPGQSFLLTNITGSANTNIATVNSTTLTFSVSGASPSTVSKTWNGGPVHGDYTATYDNVTLTAGQTVGSQISVNLISIEAQITVGGVNTSITCSVANGQLTANNPGETLKLVSVNVVAPAADPAPTAPSSTTSTSSNSKTTSSATTNSDNSSGTTSPTSYVTPYYMSEPPKSSTSSGQNIIISVRDHKGQPVSGARVVLDSLPMVKTDATGKAFFTAVASGSHNISVTANGKTVTKVINVANQLGADTLGVQIQMPAPPHTLQTILIGIGAVILAAAGAVGWLLWHHINKKHAQLTTTNPTARVPLPPLTPMPQTVTPPSPSPVPQAPSSVPQSPQPPVQPPPTPPLTPRP